MTILLFEDDVRNIIAKHFKVSIENVNVDDNNEYSVDGVEVIKVVE